MDNASETHLQGGWLKAYRASGLAIKSVKQLDYGIWVADLSKSDLQDLTPLKGAPISDLNLGNTAVPT